jgi:hypothetical protein
MPLRVSENYLRYWLRRLKPRQKLFRILEEELTRLGYWKGRPRGKPGVKNIRGRRDDD